MATTEPSAIETPSEETEVKIEDAPVESADAPETMTEKALREQKATIESIVPNKEVKTYIVGKGDHQVKLTQAPLSYFAKIEWFALLSETIDVAMSGDEGMTFSGMLSQLKVNRGEATTLSLGDFADADVFIRGILKITRNAPEFLAESYCIWLGVARGNRAYVKQLMNAPVEDGGLSDDDGIGVVQTFLDQNMDAIESFFSEKIPALAKRARGLSKIKFSRD